MFNLFNCCFGPNRASTTPKIVDQAIIHPNAAANHASLSVTIAKPTMAHEPATTNQNAARRIRRFPTNVSVAARMGTGGSVGGRICKSSHNCNCPFAARSSGVPKNTVNKIAVRARLAIPNEMNPTTVLCQPVTSNPRSKNQRKTAKNIALLRLNRRFHISHSLAHPRKQPRAR